MSGHAWDASAFTRLAFAAGFGFAVMGTSAAVAQQSSGLKIENPDKRLWRLKNEGALFNDETTYQCVHSLCPPLTSFNVGEAKGPAKRPNKAELQKIAAHDLPAALARGREPVSPPKVTQTTIKGWPALRGTYTIKVGEREIGVAFAEIHLDGQVILMRAASGDRAYAPHALDAFIESTTLRQL